MVAILTIPGICADKTAKNVKKFEKRISHKNPKIRAQSAEGLAKMQSKESIEKLIRQLETEKDETVRVHLVDSIAQIGGKDASEALRKALNSDPSVNVRSMVCLKLGIMKNESAKDSLIEVFENKKEDVNLRISASSALLGFLGDAKVYKTIEKTIKSDEQILKFGVVNSLRGYKRTQEGMRLLNIALYDKDETISELAGSILTEK
ncbi:MAG: HEAT repeat domain-containing protein [Endomicrobiales bacterium]|nr:HEAT repeat domain-containing protein [Endomicrobiales bacterium]